MVATDVAHRLWRGSVFVIVLAISSLSGCGPLPKGEYWKGSYVHLNPPRYRFDVPEGWREARVSDFSSLGFNRRMFATLDAATRSAFLQRAELDIQAIDTGLISARGAWIQIGSEAGSGGWYSYSLLNPLARDSFRFGPSDREKQAIWGNFSARRIERAPPTDKPTLTLESIEVVTYGLNRALRLRFRSDESRGSMHWTVLGMYTANDTVSLAHLGIPEEREEGLAGLEAIASTLRFD